MNAEHLWTTAVRRVTQAAGPVAPLWLRRHGLATPPGALPREPSDALQILDRARAIAHHGRLLEAGLAAGREPDWFLHPGRGLRMREVYDLAVLLLAPVDWATARAAAQTDEARHALALALNLVCKTLDIPLGAVALDQLELYAWRPKPGNRLLRFLVKQGRAPGRLERWVAGRRV